VNTVAYLTTDPFQTFQMACLVALINGKEKTMTASDDITVPDTFELTLTRADLEKGAFKGLDWEHGRPLRTASCPIAQALMRVFQRDYVAVSSTTAYVAARRYDHDGREFVRLADRNENPGELEKWIGKPIHFTRNDFPV
jgi:hypothetical protein